MCLLASKIILTIMPLIFSICKSIVSMQLKQRSSNIKKICQIYFSFKIYAFALANPDLEVSPVNIPPTSQSKAFKLLLLIF